MHRRSTSLHALSTVTPRASVWPSPQILKMETENDNVEFSKITYTFLDLVRTATLRKRTFITLFVWFCTSFSYYGMALNLQGFKINIFLLMALFGLVDFPSVLAGNGIAKYIGRRVGQSGSLLLAGFISITLIFISEDMVILRASLAVIGKGSIAASFNLLYLFTGEIFPTIMRQNSIGAGSTMARVGAMLAPLVIHSGDIYPLIPQITYSVVCLSAGLAAMMLPETRNTNLPDTVNDLLQQKKGEKSMHTIESFSENSEVTSKSTFF